MAHHQKEQADAQRRSSAVQNLLKMFTLSNAPTVSTCEEDVASDSDEPPDDVLSPLRITIPKDRSYPKASSKPQNPRRESLLTRAILADSVPSPTSPIRTTSRGLSTTSSHSAASMASTAELTSDLSSYSRSMTPSPPLPTATITLPTSKPHQTTQIVIAPITKDDKPAVAGVGEAAVEKSLGRKRCIMFACGGKSDEKKDKPETPVEKPQSPAEPPKRKCMLTFACPTRKTESEKQPEPTQKVDATKSPRKPSPAPPSKRRLSADVSADQQPTTTTETTPVSPVPKTPISPPTFHEFGSSHDETDAWVHQPAEYQRKLTIDDCMQKENAIRQIAKEAEEEAEEEEREQEELDEEEEDDELRHVDDFAPSDESDGNESDDEEGFADSDDESDAGSDYQFWAPSTTTAQTSVENLTLSHFSSRGRSRASSIESEHQPNSPPRSTQNKFFMKRRQHKLPRMRPGTPELPDSTDFVCGTFDEDRPLEAAYISSREQKKRQKHVPIPQDIDPSFPTSDLEDNEEQSDEEDESFTAGGPAWLKDQFKDMEREGHSSAVQTKEDILSPTTKEIPFARPALTRRPTNGRSPPPKRGLCRSPPPRKLFGHSPSRLRSPPPNARLRSPPGSPYMPVTGMAMNRLAQRPLAQDRAGGRTSSLPRTPNPFYKRFNVGSPSISNVASGAVTPAVEQPTRPDMHVRGPVDIVMGLRNKREKRKAKFWRQNCRKAAKEQAEKRCVPGRGAERMKELGLECAERTRGYGLNQPKLVISL